MNWVLFRPLGQRSMSGGEGDSPCPFLSFGPWPRLLAEAHSYTTERPCTNIPFRGAEQWPALEGSAAAPNSFPWAVPDIPSFWWEQPRMFGEPGKVMQRADQVFGFALGNPEKESEDRPEIASLCIYRPIMGEMCSYWNFKIKFP